MKRRNVLTSPRLSELKKRRRRARRNKILIFTAGVAALLSVFAYFSRLSSLNIAEIQVVGNKVIDADTIKQTIASDMSGKYLGLFPKTNVLYFPEGYIEKSIKDEYKSIKDISLSVEKNKTLKVTLSEREAKYTWCGASLPEAGKTPKCYFMDDSGFIFGEAPYFSGNVYFKFFGKDGIDPENPSGNYFIKDNFAKVMQFKDTVANLGINPTALYVDDNGDANFLLAKQGVAGPKIMFSLDSDFDSVAENLQAALSTEPLKSKFKNNYAALQYIDLRFGNKVYDKFGE